MTSTKGPGYAEAILGDLKGFQRRTAEYAFERLYKADDSTRRFLVADEVGLGKTLVAAGVIALAIDHLTTRNTRRIDVIYICSNQAIARQNIDRIRHRLSIDTKPLAERITLLPRRLDTLDKPVNLIALTPGTSFNSASAEGVVEERVILFWMLEQAWGDLGYDARKVFLGGLKSVSRFREYESHYHVSEIDAGIVEKFQSAVGGPGSEIHQEFMRVRDQLTEGLNPESVRQRQTHISKLRRILAHACLDALEPDLIVLDEFQRFRDLLSPETESGELANRLFEYEDGHTSVRTLLLSATPYKMYTLSHETDEDHYRDFLQTVAFLEGAEGSVEALEKSLRLFRAALPQVTAGGDADFEALCNLSQSRDQIQSALSRVMSRTERRGRLSGGDPMLEPRVMKVDLQVEDVQTYLAAREVAMTVDAPGVMEYWKSAPYLLSFMDRYKLSDRVKAAVEADLNGTVAQLVRTSPTLRLPKQKLEQRLGIDGANGRMRALLDDLDESQLTKLLWLPPSLPEHSLGRDFERARTITKRLVFSSWAMVPRAIAVMASYDAERRYIPDSARRYEAQLLGVTSTSYSLFSILTPSAALADAGDALQYPKGDANELFNAIQERLRPEVDRITYGASTDGPPQEIWYAVAPLLLDRQSNRTMGWLQSPPAIRTKNIEQDAGESTAWQYLVGRVARGLADPASLGRPPRDLLEVMASLALGSPANATLRALSRVTSTSLTDDGLKLQAMNAAHAFRSLFRTPASEGLLRNMYRPALPGGGGEYWRRILAYGFEGGLTAVLHEFFQVILESDGAATGPPALVETLCQILRLGAGTLDVPEWDDDRATTRKTFTMRQHLARRYGNGSLSGADLQTSEHLDAVRRAFNSPFWPFVLVTTSVGQEGLDFHWYCHAVVHWNLPPNPVDLEQREGRIHRYHGHAIRKNIAQAVGTRVISDARSSVMRAEQVNLWDLVYRLADEEFLDDDGLVPHWVFTGGDARIQRYSPTLPLSRDADRLDALRRSLAVYRMVFGQPRQEDLLEFLLREVPDDSRDILWEALTINLRPPL